MYTTDHHKRMGNEGVNCSLLLLHSWMNLHKWPSTAVLKMTYNINSKLIDISLCPWPSILFSYLTSSPIINVQLSDKLQKLLCPVILYFTIWWSVETEIVIYTEISKVTYRMNRQNMYFDSYIISPLVPEQVWIFSTKEQIKTRH